MDSGYSHGARCVDAQYSGMGVWAAQGFPPNRPRYLEVRNVSRESLDLLDAFDSWDRLAYRLVTCHYTHCRSEAGVQPEMPVAVAPVLVRVHPLPIASLLDCSGVASHELAPLQDYVVGLE